MNEENSYQKVELEKKETKSNTLIDSGLGLGAFGAASLALTGSVCPL